MKYINTILALLFSVAALSQNVTIDYQAWNPSGTTCSFFVNPTNVPATIGSTSGTIEHQRKLGETRYINSDQSIQMQTVYQTTGGVSKGGRYRIAYNFKANYSYIIYVTAAAVENTVGFPTGPFIRLDVNNIGGGGSTGCNGPETVNYNAGGNPAAVKLSSNSFQEFQFVFPPLGTQPTLEVTAFPAVDGGTKTVRIRKIRIVETPPAASFTITPSPIPVVCGKANPVTLTINNVNNTPGVTGYTWNLGTGNTWIYNGSAAPATIATATNTLTLSPTCGVTPGSITSTVSVGANSYQTNTATVSSTNETLSISGSNPLCSGSAIYSVANLPTCGATVTGWAASPSGIVSVTDNGNNTATITKLANGQVTVTATVNLTNSCNTSTVNLSLPLSSGAIQLSGYYRIASDYHNYGIFNPLYNNNSPIWLPANQIFTVDVFITSPGIPSPTWTRASNSYPFSWGTSGTFLSFSGTSGSYAYEQRDGIFEFTANTGCGVTTTTYTWPVIVQGGSFSVTASPNPATDNLTVSIVDKSPEIKALSENETVTMTLYDLNSTLAIKVWKFKNNQTKFNLNISNLKKGNYILKVQKSKYQQSDQIILK